LAFDPEGSKFVVGVGRLSKVKGFDMLVRAFSGAAADRPGWKLIILGDGEEKDSILDEVRKTGMEDRVIMPGAVKNTAVILKKCALFVMSSRYEGFPNALCEAMSCGLACISFDCPIGPARIIESGFNGILVPAGDVEKLKIEMGVLMDDAGERARLGANAAKITETLGGDRIMKMWDDLIIRIHQ